MKTNVPKLVIVLFLCICLYASCSDDDVTNVPLTQIELNESEIQLGLGEVFKLVVNGSPENATTSDISWSSSNKKVAQVQANSAGLVAGVMGIGTGEAIITVKLNSEDVEKKVKVNVQRRYCDVSGTGGYNPTDVTTTGGTTNIDHSQSGIPKGNYGYYKDEVLSISSGSGFTLEIIQSNNWSRTMVWIDWSGDGNFAGEGEQVVVFGLGSQLNDGPFSASVNVPADAAKGSIRMRIVTGDAWTYDEIPINVCGKLANSTIKDFIVEIL